MPEIKNTFAKGSMNKDLDERIIPVGQYRDALNIQVSTSEGSDVGTCQNILGNARVDEVVGASFGGASRCVGAIADEKNDILYWFVSGDDKDAILEYHDNGTVTPVLIDKNKDVLLFDFNDTITGINLIDDLLFWTDNRNEPRKINIKNCKLGTPDMGTHTKLFLAGKGVPAYDSLGVATFDILDIKEEHIVVIKKKPHAAPKVVFTESTAQEIFNVGRRVSQLVLSVDMSSFNDGSLPFVGDIIPLSHKSSINHFEPFPIIVGDIVFLKRLSHAGHLPNSYEIKAKIDSFSGGWSSGNGYGLVDINLEILEIKSSIPLGENEMYQMIKLDDRNVIYEQTFIRFATRYKYADGEFSAFSPFTQPVFLAGRFGFHPTKDPYNVAMQSKIIDIRLQDLITDDTPKDVVQIDILFKKEDSTTIYSVNSIKWDDPAPAGSALNYWNSIDYSNYSTILTQNKQNMQDLADDIDFGGITINPNYIFTRSTGYRGQYTITTENIYAALPENQMLRPWDNVPRKALAQEITGNRLVYGNYLQNYTLKDYLGNKVSPNIDVIYEGRNEDPDVLSGESNGLAVKSIKSNRTYQLGVVYGDKYGRETPVFTSVSGTQVVPVDLNADTNGTFLGAASLKLNLATKLIGEQPNWAHYFKYYLKQTTGEYYNLTMDRVYKSVEDENFWLSFPSSDRNKLKDGDYISIKKEVEKPIQVAAKNKLKVIDIQNEAPESIKFDYVSIGDGGGSQADLVALFPDQSAAPAVDVKRISIDKETWMNVEFGSDLDILSPSAKLSIQFHITDGQTLIKSKQYHVLAWFREEAGVDGKWNLLLESTISDSDSWVEQSAGVLNYTDELKITIYELQQKPATEFEGRFFVKVISNAITQRYLLPHVGAVNDFQIIARAYTFWLADQNNLLNPADPGWDGNNGIYNVSHQWLGGSGNTNDINGVSSGSPHAATDTSLGWHDVTKFNTDKRSSQGFFIDNTYFAAGQEEPGSNGLWDAAKSGRMWKGEAKVDSGVNGNWFVNGLEGIIIADGEEGVDHYGLATGQRTWSTTKVWSQEEIPSMVPSGIDYAPVWDNTYEASTTGYGVNVSQNASEGCYLHLSYSSVGVDLHDGNFQMWTIFGSMGFSPWQDEELFKRNLQWIRSSSIVLDTTTGPSTFWEDVFNTIFGGSLSFASSGENSWVNDAGAATPMGWNAAAQEAHDNQFNPEWSGGSGAGSVIAQFQTGSRFKYAGSDTIYTIKGVSTKFLYNHTPWSPMYRPITGPATQKTGDSVSEAYQAWVNADYPQAGQQTTIDLQNKIVDFGRANNRRVCYILQLDKDPRDDTDLNPLDVADVDDFAAMQFIDEHVEPGQNLLPISPAVFETEAKEDIDLNIYYEVTDALPLQLDLTTDSQYPINSIGVKLNPDSTKGHVWAPIGSKVVCNILDSSPSSTAFQNQIDAYGVDLYVRVKGWDGNIVEIESPGLRVNPTGQGEVYTDNQAGYDGQTLIYGHTALNPGKLKFMRKDMSYTQAIIYKVKEIKENYITKLEMFPKLYDKRIGLSYYNCFTFGNGVESNRIRDDYNESYIRHGVKASTVLEEPYEEERRKYGLIYSGIYNSTSGINNLNQFIQAEKITKDVMPAYGSIQKLYARNKDLVTFCEDKVLQVMVDKDLLFNADGNSQLMATNRFLGTAEPFRGNYGISKNPESFAAESFRAYFTDKQRGAVLRLSMDGLTPISDYGMHDWFRDNLRDGGRLYGSYDLHKRDYNLTISYPDGSNKLSNPDFDEGGTYLSNISGSNLVSNGVLDGYTSSTTVFTFLPEILQDGTLDIGFLAWYPMGTPGLITVSDDIANLFNVNVNNFTVNANTGYTFTISPYPSWIQNFFSQGYSFEILSHNGSSATTAPGMMTTSPISITNISDLSGYSGYNSSCARIYISTNETIGGMGVGHQIEIQTT